MLDLLPVDAQGQRACVGVRFARAQAKVLTHASRLTACASWHEWEGCKVLLPDRVAASVQSLTMVLLSPPQIALVRLYQGFVLRLLPGQEPLELRTTITMAPKHGVRVTAVPRS